MCSVSTFRSIQQPLQALGQGIIGSLEASYRRKYTEQLVEYFERHNKSPPPIDILQAIHLISAAWIELPRHIIYNCWSQASIHSQLRRSPSAYRSFEQYLEHLQSGTFISINCSLELDTSYHSGQVTDLVHDFLNLTRHYYYFRSYYRHATRHQ